jgi:hypothetical protein
MIMDDRVWDLINIMQKCSAIPVTGDWEKAPHVDLRLPREIHEALLRLRRPEREGEGNA